MKAKVMIDEVAFMPEKAHEEDAGFDLRTPIPFVVEPHGSYSVDTGVHFCMEKGYCGLLVSKSGLNVKHGLTSTGLVDAGYMGSIVVKLYNDSDKPYPFKRGDKISQMMILPVPDVEIEVYEKFGFETDRGDNGFGSTGK